MAGTELPAFARTPISEIGQRLISGQISLEIASHPDIQSAQAIAGQGHVGLCAETGEAYIATKGGIQSFPFLEAVGYGRIASAYTIGQEVAPIQVRSDAPYILGGILFTVLPYNPATAVARMTNGMPFLMSLSQVITLVAGCLRHASGLNARCDQGDLPESARIDMGGFLGMRLAADRATDRGLLLSRIDNAILSSLFSLNEPSGTGVISEWIGERIDEHHLPNAIEAAIGTLAWRGFVKRDDRCFYALTEHGEQALRSEASKMAALHHDLNQSARRAA